MLVLLKSARLKVALSVIYSCTLQIHCLLEHLLWNLTHVRWSWYSSEDEGTTPADGKCINSFKNLSSSHTKYLYFGEEREIRLPCTLEFLHLCNHLKSWHHLQITGHKKKYQIFNLEVECINRLLVKYDWSLCTLIYFYFRFEAGGAARIHKERLVGGWVFQKGFFIYATHMFRPVKAFVRVNILDVFKLL